MGGSLARALKKLPDPPEVRALSTDPGELEAGLSLGVLDRAVESPEALLRELDLLVYATPLGTALELMKAHAPLLEPTTVVTDLVSLKAPIRDRMDALGLAERYVGSHPMAGGEGRGFSASRDDLFAGARVWMVPGGAPPITVGRVEAFWQALGARPEPLGARAHDRLMTWVSHLPQLAANALALALEAEGLGREDLGPGGRDMTRLAGSSPGMWRDLFRHAPPELPSALSSLEKELAGLRTLIEEGRSDAVAAGMARTALWVAGNGEEEA